MAEFSDMVNWEDECYAEIRKGDKVYYKNKQGQIHKGIATLYGPAGWVLDCDHGAQVVGEGYNYMGHTKDKRGDRVDDHFGKWLAKPYS
jgi:hypothetical protein